MNNLKHFALTMLVALISITASAYDYDFEVDGIYYNYVSLEDSTCEVTREDYYSKSYSGDIVIPSTVTYNGKKFSVTSIGSHAFYGCSSLTSVEIPNSVASIEFNAFHGCSSLTSVEIPNSVISIGLQAFSFCSGLTSVVISNSVTSIGSNAFSYCSALTEVTIPNSVTEIGSCAFIGCNNLKSFTGKFASEDNRCLIVDGVLNSFAPAGLTSYTIPNSVTMIRGLAFANCRSLTSVVIPNSVTSIGTEPFSGCTSLTSFTGKFASEDNRCLIVDGELNSFAPAGLTSYTIPNSVTSIGLYVFECCTSLTSVVIPNSVTSIGRGAFYRCTSLTSVVIPNSVTSIGDDAFNNCSKLESVVIPNSVTEIGRDVFRDCTSLTSVVIPNSVTSIGDNAFSNCSKLESVVIPNSVTSIGDNAFNNCSKLESVVIPNSVTEIGRDVFRDCTSLTSVVIPNSVTSIGNGAFYKCSSLTKVTCWATEPPKLGQYVFYLIASDAILYVPASAFSYYTGNYYNNYWPKYFSEILPISGGTYSMEIGLPEDYSDSRYRNMTLELVAKDSDKTYKIVVSDKGTYTFSGLLAGSSYTLRMKNRWGDVLGEINTIEVSDEDVKVTFESLLQPKTVTMNVLTPDGEDVTERTTVSWYKADGELMMQGASISGVLAGSEMAYTITLPGEMLTEYTAPAKQTLKVGEKENAVRHTLETLGRVTLAGNVYDANGKALPYAVLTITPLVNGKYGNAVTATTDAAGHYEIELPNYAVKITVTANNYVSQTIELPCVADGLGDISLKKVNGLCVNVMTDYADQANVAYRVLDMSGNEMNGCIYQGRSIVMPATVGIGDELTVVAYSKNNRFKDTPQRVVLDSKNTYVEISIVEYGCLNAKCDGDGYGSVSILYNAAGEQAAKAAFREGTASFETLPDGQYTVVAMKKSGVLNSVLNLSALKSTGLTAGTDFLTATATVESGAVAEVTLGAIPELDESKLYLASGDGTYFMPGKAELTISNYQVLKAKVDLKPEYAGRVKDAVLVVDIPSSCEFVEGSVISGNNFVYQKDGNRILVPLENIGDLSRFCIIPMIGGETRLSAFVQAEVDGEEVLLPIGSAYFKALNFSLATVEKTSKTTIPLRGAAMPNSEVLIYDNETLVGKTASLASGQWAADITFAKPYSHSMHEIYAEVLTSDGKRLLTETQVVEYDKSYPYVENVTMLYKSYKIDFDPMSGKTSSGYYSYVPGDPYFTFTADFSNTDPSLVSNMNFKVLASDGTTRTLEGKYNEATGNWVASSKYADTHKLPVNVKVEYDVTNVSTEADQDRIDAENKFLDLVVEEYANIVKNSNFKVIKNTEDELFAAYEQAENDSIYMRIKTIKDESVKELKDIARKLIIDNEDVLLYDSLSTDRAILYIWKKNQTLEITFSDFNFEKIEEARCNPISRRKTLDFNMNNIWQGIVRGLNHIPLVGNSDLVKECDEYNYWKQKWIQMPETHVTLKGHSQSLLFAKCKDGSYKLDDLYFNHFSRVIKNLSEECDHFEYNMGQILYRYQRSIRKRTSFRIGLKAASIALGVLGASVEITSEITSTFLLEVGEEIGKTVVGNLIEGIITETGDTYLNDSFIGQFVAHYFSEKELEILKEYGDLNQNIINQYKKCEKEDEDDDDDGYDNTNYPTPPVTPSIDPSGYVYEAVPSNRLQGVTATVYYMQQTEDMYGDITEEPVVWNAAEFGQQNPLTTDEQGMYAWDVPQGMWQVKFEKEGYETTYSEWLPVPPPQLDVNIAMVQAKQPEVTNLHAYTDGITIEFDKFMLPEMLTPENIKVSQNGTDIAGTVTLINSEAGKDGKSYCSKIEFVPTTELAEGEATVFVSRQVKSYADMQMSADFTKTVKVETRVSGIDVAETVKVFSGSTVEIEATVLPMSAAAGKKFVMEEMNPYIASVDKGSITMDGNGHVSFEVKGLIPGKAVVRLSVEGYDVYQDVTINVVDVEKVSAPAATLASGSVVVKGTEVRLYCATEGATIYYTTDGSCPCDLATAYVYDGTPIVIDETVTIKAIAMKQDMEDSRIAEFTYIVEVPTAIATAKTTDELRIYPLPMRDVVNITVGGKEIRRITINTMNGTTVRSLDNTGTELQLNVQSLSPGIYIVNATTADGTLHKKVLKVE